MKKDKKQKTLQRIMEYMKPYRFLIFASLVLAVISVALTLYVPILTGQGVDCIISKGNDKYYKNDRDLYRIDGGSAVADESCQ